MTEKASVPNRNDDVPPARFGQPATYRVIVRGRLGEKWKSRLGGLAVCSVEEADGTIILCGALHDQAELHGLLTTLHGLHLSIIKVEQTGGCP